MALRRMNGVRVFSLFPSQPRSARARSLSSRRCMSSFYSEEDGMSSRQRTALVLGSSGCLGGSVSKHLSSLGDLRVFGADVLPPASPADEAHLDAFISLPKYDKHPGLGEVTTALVKGISVVLGEGDKIDAIICTAGGLRGDPPLPSPEASDDEFLEGAKAYGETIDNMMEMNLYPVLAAGYAAHRFMAEEGLFTVIGATASLLPTPGMLGYGLSKAGVHHFAQTLGEVSGKGLTTKSRRQKARQLRRNAGRDFLESLSVVGILPMTIDTPSNREAMPSANFDEWTKPVDIAKEIGSWIQNPHLRPHSGSLVKVFPAKGGNGAVFNLAR